MNQIIEHDVYEEWLFTYYDGGASEQRGGERLDGEQEAALQEHLKTCESCRSLATAWRAVDAQLREAPQAEPLPGFTQRWMALQQAGQQRLQLRQTLFVLGGSIVGAVVLFFTLAALALPYIQSPKALLWVWFYRLLTLWNFTQVAEQILLPTLQSVTNLIPGVWWIVFAGLLTLMSVLWVVSYRYLTISNPRRV